MSEQDPTSVHIYEAWETVPPESKAYGVREYGYSLPDGREVWDLSFDPYVEGNNGGSLKTAAGRGKAQDKFREQLQRFGIPTDGMELEFLERVKFVSYSTAQALKVS